MTTPGKRRNAILGKLIRTNEAARARAKKGNEFDATKPSVLFWLTMAYIGVVFFLIIGVPWQGTERMPIPPEDLPIAIKTAVIFYSVIVGGLYLSDTLRK